MNLRSIKPPKLGSALSSVPNTAATDLCPVLMPTHNKRCEITGTRSKDATHTKKSSRWKINLYGRKSNLPPPFREKGWNRLLLCVEGLALGKDV